MKTDLDLNLARLKLRHSERTLRLLRGEFEQPPKIRPRGEPLPPVHAGVPISAEQIDAAFDVWDREMPEFAGLLNAKKVK